MMQFDLWLLFGHPFVKQLFKIDPGVNAWNADWDLAWQVGAPKRDRVKSLTRSFEALNNQSESDAKGTRHDDLSQLSVQAGRVKRIVLEFERNGPLGAPESNRSLVFALCASTTTESDAANLRQ